jgi:DNA-directed RNA polymerase specialized sigma24 family protein
MSAVRFSPQSQSAERTPTGVVLAKTKDRQMQVLFQITSSDRAVLVMLHFDEIGTARIALELRITEEAAKGRLLQALLRLRRLRNARFEASYEVRWRLVSRSRWRVGVSKPLTL